MIIIHFYSNSLAVIPQMKEKALIFHYLFTANLLKKKKNTVEETVEESAPSSLKSPDRLRRADLGGWVLRKLSHAGLTKN